MSGVRSNDLLFAERLCSLFEETIMQRVMRRILATAIAVSASAAGFASAAPPTAEQALGLSPIQKNVQYDVPDKLAVAKCKVTAEAGDVTGWIVRTDAGELLRRFLDSNGDNKVDQWCYYRHGVEVYRDIDANFNGMADQYRWLGTAGTRWGLDKNEDGKVDEWKQISAEEVTSELVTAVRERDASRFAAIMLTDSELKGLGLGEDRTAEIHDKLLRATKGFGQFAAKQKIVTSKSEWLNFGGNQPGILAAGTNGSTKDLFVYDNVAAVIETDGKTAQLPVGSIVKVGETWKLFDLPSASDELASAAPPGYFFQAPLPKASDNGDDTPAESGLSPEVQKLIADLERVDKDLAIARTPAAQARLNEDRATLMEQLADKSAAPDEKANWQRQLADTVSAGVQSGAYPEGIAKLKALHDKLVADKAAGGELAYVKFRYMTADYTQSVQKDKADFVKVQEQWLKDLEAFVEAYPTCEDAPEAMLQLAIAQEFAGKDEEATKWFDAIVEKFPKHDLAKKAAGASYRLNSVGQSIRIRGKTVDGRDFDLATMKGKVVLIHYWSTWCEPCKADMDQLKTLQAKYAKQGFALVGISLDNETSEVAAFLKTKKLSWPQLFEPGGLESRLANELGVLTLPTMILVDKQGKVISRSISVGELETELDKQLR
jgi:thiol-disulfide isomerase/thioredoxin